MNYNKNNFTYLDKLIHSGENVIKLEEDIILDKWEDEKFYEGIIIDVNDLILDGNGHKIDAKQKTRIFKCIGNNITIKNIILKNGYSEDSGAAIANAASVDIVNSILKDNTAKIDGGAVYNDVMGKINIMNTEINNNISQMDGGAIFNWGELNIKDSIIEENTSKEDAGAIHNGGLTHKTSLLGYEKRIDLSDVKLSI